jgi:transposase
MAKYIQVATYLTTDELEGRYRRARGGVERSHWQMLWLMSSGKRTAEVAEVTGYCQDWIRKLVQHYNEQGEQALGDKRRGHAGRPRLLTPEQEAELRGELERAEAAGGAWNSVQTAGWMSAKLGRVVRANRGRETLQRLGFSTKTPRPRHAKADVQAQDLFKKNVP